MKIDQLFVKRILQKEARTWEKLPTGLEVQLLGSTLQHSAFHELFGSTQLFNVGCLLIFLPLTLGEQTAPSAVEEQMPLSKVGKGLGKKMLGTLSQDS
jgi:hypothetical protein